MENLSGFLALAGCLGLALLAVGVFAWAFRGALVTIWHSPNRLVALLVFLGALVVFGLWVTRNMR